MPGEQLLLINPRRKRRTKSRRRHRRVSARRHHPRRHRVRAHVARRGRGRYRVRAHMANPRRRRRHHARRRNPIMGGDMGGVLMPVAAGAAGAVALDIVWGYLSPMFGTLVSNQYMNIAAKAVLAVAGGWGIGKVTSRRTGRYVTAGALTVYGYQLLESIARSALPSVPFAGLGAYLRPGMAGVSYNPAPYLGWSPALPSSAPVGLAGANTGEFGAYMQPGMSGLGGGGSGMF